MLNRTRFIYQLSAVALNEHYFVLSLVTSAGTYVKEFVHGDLGRTVPSISSILGAHADILQLDVTWLYDEYRGGGEPLLTHVLACYSGEDNEHRSLNDMKLIPFRPTKKARQL